MDKFEKLLVAARKLLACRYSDGEVDAVAMSQFAGVVEELDPTISHVEHRLITVEEAPPFKARRGCLDCDVWIDSVELID